MCPNAATVWTAADFEHAVSPIWTKAPKPAAVPTINVGPESSYVRLGITTRNVRVRLPNQSIAEHVLSHMSNDVPYPIRS